MKITSLSLFFWGITQICLGQISEFNQPWLNPDKAIILDPYHGNDMDWEKIATDNRVVAIIHKATQGYRIDKKYNERKKTAKERGYKWGSYHLGLPGDPIKQADYYLDKVGIYPDELYALDIEDLNPQKSMPIDSAVKFIGRIFEKTGRYPLVYCNWVVLNEIARKYDSNSIFAKCPLWHARFRKSIPKFNQGTWKTYTVWQFSCELNCSETGECPYRVPGTNSYMDINVYNGTISDLKARWPKI